MFKSFLLGSFVTNAQDTFLVPELETIICKYQELFKTVEWHFGVTYMLGFDAKTFHKGSWISHICAVGVVVECLCQISRLVEGSGGNIEIHRQLLISGSYGKVET